MNYPSVRIEGAILSADILEKLDDAVGQRPADFGFEPTIKVKDEIARAWADAQEYWRIYQRRLEGLKTDSPATTETRNQWIVPLLGLLGYNLEYHPKSFELNGKLYPISHRVNNRGDAALHILGSREPSGLDRKPEKAALRMSAHAMMQEYLNLNEQLYGIVTNGRLLRLLRDSSRLVKLTYLEFDLDRIFTDGLFADFAVLYRLLHVSRLPATHEASAESLIERYHQDSVDSGARIRDGLSKAVETAIRSFANGFLRQTDNRELIDAITDGRLTSLNYYQYLLRLIYRLLFLMVIEERNLIYPLGTSTDKRSIYDNYYSVQRLRRLSEKRFLADRRHNDHWLSLLVTFRLFEDGGPGRKLGIDPLAGDLFSPRAIGLLQRCTLDNESLLGCFRALGLYENGSGQLVRVNYGALNVEEFGSVYEGLLEYEPVFLSADSQVEFDFAQGDQRASTGSHYTPDDLVQPLIKHSLDYLIADKRKEADPAQALLSLRVADISCGSGHILLAAARRIATELAIVRTGEEQPSPSAFRAAVCDVIRHCIYGVDLNPLAVELCKVALWLEAHIPGQPLNFLDHHIKCGNAIVGFARREELEKGVPDEAFATIPGDGKEIAASFRKRNKLEREIHENKLGKQESLAFTPEVEKHLSEVLKGWRTIAALPERTPAEIEAKKQHYQNFASGQDTWLLNQVAAIPVAQFYIEKTKENQPKLITDEEYRRYLDGQRTPQGQSTAMAWAMAMRKRFFHWFLEFPEIMERGGFDCILGNPPYLGDKKQKRTYGEEFQNFTRWEYAAKKAPDLVAFFCRRIVDLLVPEGYAGLITTNTVAQGATREEGLDIILNRGARINFANPSIPWPGQANVIVSIFSIFKSAKPITCFINRSPVDQITGGLREPVSDGESPAIQLKANENLAFTGTYVNGGGFFLNLQQAEELLARDSAASAVVRPHINGSDLNSSPIQRGSRYVIDFGERTLSQACQFQTIFQVVEDKVKPARLKQTDKSNRENWWLHARRRPELYAKIRDFHEVLVCARVSSTCAISFVPAKQVLDEKLVVFAMPGYDSFSFLQSCFHWEWVWFRCTTMKNDVTYGVQRVFETLPIPEALQSAKAPLASIGERYHEHRRELMLRLWLGLTAIYNLFHNRDLTPAIVAKVSKKPEEAETGYQGILELRRLHRELDQAVLAAYGWTDLDLGHDFHEVETLPENDRVRYTISPQARKELLKRLLALNHQRAEEEKNTFVVKEATAKYGTKDRKKKVDEEPGLFDLSQLEKLSFPATDKEKALTAAAMAIIEKTGEISSMDHLDVMLLATHPEWCKSFLDDAAHKQFEVAVKNVATEFFTKGNETIMWKDCRDYLEKRHALRVNHASSTQPINRGTNFLEVRESFSTGVDSIVSLALDALKGVHRLRQHIDEASEVQNLLLQTFDQRHREYKLSA